MGELPWACFYSCKMGIKHTFLTGFGAYYKWSLQGTRRVAIYKWRLLLLLVITMICWAGEQMNEWPVLRLWCPWATLFLDQHCLPVPKTDPQRSSSQLLLRAQKLFLGTSRSQLPDLGTWFSLTFSWLSCGRDSQIHSEATNGVQSTSQMKFLSEFLWIECNSKTFMFMFV